MRHRVAGRKLGRSTGHRRALYRNLVTDLLRYEKITTTEAKAKEVSGYVEKFITRAKKKGLATQRLMAKSFSKDLVKKLLDELAPRYKNRPGGYTRIIRLGARKSDAARMTIIELVKEEKPEVKK